MIGLRSVQGRWTQRRHCPRRIAYVRWSAGMTFSAADAYGVSLRQNLGGISRATDVCAIEQIAKNF